MGEPNVKLQSRYQLFIGGEWRDASDGGVSLFCRWRIVSFCDKMKENRREKEASTWMQFLKESA